MSQNTASYRQSKAQGKQSQVVDSQQQQLEYFLKELAQIDTEQVFRPDGERKTKNTFVNPDRNIGMYLGDRQCTEHLQQDQICLQGSLNNTYTKQQQKQSKVGSQQTINETSLGIGTQAPQQLEQSIEHSQKEPFNVDKDLDINILQSKIFKKVSNISESTIDPAFLKKGRRRGSQVQAKSPNTQGKRSEQACSQIFGQKSDNLMQFSNSMSDYINKKFQKGITRNEDQQQQNKFAQQRYRERRRLQVQNLQSKVSQLNAQIKEDKVQKQYQEEHNYMQEKQDFLQEISCQSYFINPVSKEIQEDLQSQNDRQSQDVLLHEIPNTTLQLQQLEESFDQKLSYISGTLYQQEYFTSQDNISYQLYRDCVLLYCHIQTNWLCQHLTTDTMSNNIQEDILYRQEAMSSVCLPVIQVDQNNIQSVDQLRQQNTRSQSSRVIGLKLQEVLQQGQIQRMFTFRENLFQDVRANSYSVKQQQEVVLQELSNSIFDLEDVDNKLDSMKRQGFTSIIGRTPSFFNIYKIFVDSQTQELKDYELYMQRCLFSVLSQQQSMLVMKETQHIGVDFLQVSSAIFGEIELSDVQ